MLMAVIIIIFENKAAKSILYQYARNSSNMNLVGIFGKSGSKIYNSLHFFGKKKFQTF